MPDNATTSIAEFTRMGKQPRTYIVTLASRPFAHAFSLSLEYTYYPPNSPRNNEFHILHGIYFAGPVWEVISIPRNDWDKANKVAQKFGLRLPKGYPYLIPSATGNNRGAIVTDCNAEHRPEFKDWIPFPLNGRDVYSLEFDKHHPIGALLPTTPRDILRTNEGKIAEEIYRAYGHPEAVIDELMKPWYEAPPDHGVIEIFEEAATLLGVYPPPPPPSSDIPPVDMNALSTEDVDHLWRISIEFINEQLAEKGRIVPIIMLYGNPKLISADAGPNDNGIYLVPLIGNTPEERDLVALNIKALADDVKAFAVVMVTESWTLNSMDKANAWVLAGNYLGDHPDRVSAAIISIELPGEQHLAQARIIAGPDGKLTVDSMEREVSYFKDLPQDVTARFVGVLKVNRR